MIKGSEKKIVNNQNRFEYFELYLHSLQEAIGFKFNANTFPKEKKGSIEDKANKKGFLDVSIHLFPIFVEYASKLQKEITADLLRNAINAFEAANGGKNFVDCISKISTSDQNRKDFCEEFRDVIDSLVNVEVFNVFG